MIWSRLLCAAGVASGLVLAPAVASAATDNETCVLASPVYGPVMDGTRGADSGNARPARAPGDTRWVRPRCGHRSTPGPCRAGSSAPTRAAGSNDRPLGGPFVVLARTLSALTRRPPTGVS